MPHNLEPPFSENIGVCQALLDDGHADNLG